MSATPPPFQPQPVAARSGSGKACLWIALFLVFGCIVLAVVAFFGFKNMMGQVSPLASCEQTFEAAEAALHAYAADHGGKLPDASSWMDAAQPYYEKEVEGARDLPGAFRDFAPSDPSSAWGCKWADGKTTGLAFNSDLSGVELAKVAKPRETPLIFEDTAASRNLAKPYGKGPSGTAPEVLGNKRKWVVYFVEGPNEVIDSKSARFP